MKSIHGRIMSNDDWTIKTVSSDDRIIEGFASTADVDRVDDIVVPDAFKRTMKTFMKAPTLLYNHKLDNAIGVVEAYKITDKGLWIRARIGKGYEPADTIWKMIEQGIVRTFSIGFSIKDEEWNKEGKRIIKDIDLHEISVVSVPANTEALFEVSPDGKTMNIKIGHEAEEKAVEPFRNLPVVDRSWSKRKAIPQIRKWASSDGSGDPDKINFNKYKKCFMWYDESRKEELTAYKLPFCYIENGRPVACKRAIMAIAAVLMGARGGVYIPESDKKKIMRIVEAYYKKWGGTAPWKREKAISGDNSNIYTKNEMEETMMLNAEEVLALCEDLIDEKLGELEELKSEMIKSVKEEFEAKIKELEEKMVKSSEPDKSDDNKDTQTDEDIEKAIEELRAIIEALKQ